MEALNWFTHMPTKGKIAVGIGGGAVLLFVWQPWKKKASTGTAASTYKPSYGTGGGAAISGSSGASLGSPATPATQTPSMSEMWGAIVASNPDIFSPKTPTPTPLPANVVTNETLTSILNGLHLVNADTLAGAIASKTNVVPVPVVPTPSVIAPASIVANSVSGASFGSAYHEPPATSSYPTYSLTPVNLHIESSFSGATAQASGRANAAFDANPTVANQTAAEKAYIAAAQERDRLQTIKDTSASYMDYQKAHPGATYQNDSTLAGYKSSNDALRAGH